MNRITKMPATIQVPPDTSLALPWQVFTIGYAINPIDNPSAIEYVNGVRKIVRNAGITSDISSQGISFTSANIIAPTITSVGVVAKAGIALNTGMKNTDSANNPATTKAVNPVRPPWATPATDST